MTSRLTLYCVAAAENVTPCGKKVQEVSKTQVTAVRKGQSALYVGLGEVPGWWGRAGAKAVGAGVATPS